MSQRSAELEAILAAVPVDFADGNADFNAVRAMMAPFHGHPVAADLHVEIRALGPVAAGWYTHARNADSPRLAFHCHGGAFVSCPLAVYHFYGEIIARELDMRVVMPDYRLAPEHVFPAAHDDCFGAYKALLESGVRAADICVLGESCGGSLALGMLLRARDEGLPMPACFVSVTGWFDLSVPGVMVGRDPFLTPAWVRNRAREYSAGKLALDDPALSPAHADLHGLPPFYLQVGEFDTMGEGARILAANASRAGVEVTLEPWPGMIQGWHGLVNAAVPEARDAWAAIRRYVDARLPP
ncbi:MAG: alpha/beta hydrolase [Pseudomonadales bacterium]|jgi:acetyl esterase/lipase|nr:alpha/beta hydrolase [Gammaproteobacteria bacterium]MBP6053984.1 alpha/beta hydrolase [Pseudomonadales bacterium]MBK6582890.1 alpha/beta hydrolase [Gammaproteobacteria bacterium]MBK7168221.1 alpha/beta hydrolase [Gammaproteobacteria bacterium]MBK7519021.1 alpha/beta hydrolase [Gammaproteobacteria bacterium]